MAAATLALAASFSDIAGASPIPGHAPKAALLGSIAGADITKVRGRGGFRGGFRAGSFRGRGFRHGYRYYRHYRGNRFRRRGRGYWRRPHGGFPGVGSLSVHRRYRLGEREVYGLTGGRFHRSAPQQGSTARRDPELTAPITERARPTERRHDKGYSRSTGYEQLDRNYFGY